MLQLYNNTPNNFDLLLLRYECTKLKFYTDVNGNTKKVTHQKRQKVLCVILLRQLVANVKVLLN